MTFNELAMLGTRRMLDRPKVEAYCREQGISVSSWLIAYGHFVATSFWEHAFTWHEASSAFNSIWPAVVKDAELPPFFFDLYLAFEDAETYDAPEARTAFSRDRLMELHILPKPCKPMA